MFKNIVTLKKFCILGICILNCIAFNFKSSALANELKEPSLIAENKKESLSLFNLRIPDEAYNEELNQKRLHHLKAHRHGAHATLGLLGLTMATAFMAKKKVDDERSARGGRMSSSDANKFNIHLISASLTLASYFTTAYLGITAPKSESMADSNQITWHKRLAFVHMPAMILGPIFAYKAYSDYKDGKNPSGVGKLHRPLMFLGGAALLGAGIVAEF